MLDVRLAYRTWEEEHLLCSAPSEGTGCIADGPSSFAACCTISPVLDDRLWAAPATPVYARAGFPCNVSWGVCLQAGEEPRQVISASLKHPSTR